LKQNGILLHAQAQRRLTTQAEFSMTQRATISATDAAPCTIAVTVVSGQRRTIPGTILSVMAKRVPHRSNPMPRYGADTVNEGSAISAISEANSFGADGMSDSIRPGKPSGPSRKHAIAQFTSRSE
jgi:hypothetical protein